MLTGMTDVECESTVRLDELLDDDVMEKTHLWVGGGPRIGNQYTEAENEDMIHIEPEDQGEYRQRRRGEDRQSVRVQCG